MQRQLAIIRELHAALVAALDAGDVEQVAELVQRRDAAVAQLQRAHDAAPAAARQAIQPELAALLPQERDLQQRAAHLRNQLRDELDRRRDPVGHREQPVMSGVVDRQA